MDRAISACLKRERERERESWMYTLVHSLHTHASVPNSLALEGTNVYIGDG